MNYKPANPERSLHDTWIFIDGDDVHLFYLSPLCEDPTRRLIGHAKSRDWLHWEELPTIELTGEPGTWDSGRIGTGYVFRANYTYYMAYTGRTDRDEAIGLAKSDDLITWTKAANRPVCPRSLRPPYDATDNAESPVSAWRDPYVLEVSAGRRIGLITARLADGDVSRRGCIAVCALRDLFSWSVRPPIAGTGSYAVMEVPEAFQFKDTWWMTFNSGSAWGRRLDVVSRTRSSGTYFLRSDSIEGNWEAPDDNLLIGSGEGRRDALVARSVVYGGERLVYHHYDGGIAADSTRALGLPKVLDLERDRLVLRPWSGLSNIWEKHVASGMWRVIDRVPWTVGSWGESRLGGFGNQRGTRGYEGRCREGVSAIRFLRDYPDVDYEGIIEVDSGRAGFLLRLDEHCTGGTFVLVDVERNEITIGGLRLGPYGAILDDFIDRVSIELGAGAGYSYRILVRDAYLEFYLDSKLVFSTIIDSPSDFASYACVVDGGTARFSVDRCNKLEAL